jgi:hypothetical protein
MRLLTSTLAAALLMTTTPGGAVEINGQTSFVAVPTKAKLTNYRWYAFECCAVYYVTLEFPEGAGADLGGVDLQQIRGAQAAFYYGPVPVQAFIGTPRHQGKALEARAEFSDDARSVDVRFTTAVTPGETVTIAFQAGVNPPEDLYTFSVTAVPAGPNPIDQMVGVIQMEIFEPVY